MRRYCRISSCVNFNGVEDARVRMFRQVLVKNIMLGAIKIMDTFFEIIQ